MEQQDGEEEIESGGNSSSDITTSKKRSRFEFEGRGGSFGAGEGAIEVLGEGTFVEGGGVVGRRGGTGLVRIGGAWGWIS